MWSCQSPGTFLYEREWGVLTPKFTDKNKTTGEKRKGTQADPEDTRLFAEL